MPKFHLENAIIDGKCAILDYICDECLDLLELNETKVKLQETQDLSPVIATYHSLVENIENVSSFNFFLKDFLSPVSKNVSFASVRLVYFIYRNCKRNDPK